MSAPETIQWSGHLVISVNRGRPAKPKHLWSVTGRLTAKPPALSPDEVSVKVAVKLPVTLFERPALQAVITVPAEAVQPVTIGLDVMDNIAEQIKQNTGFDVRIIPQP